MSDLPDTFAMFAPTPWMERANCRGMDANLFHPVRSGIAAKLVRQAKQVCDGCDVRDECLDYALEHNIKVGVYGGTTPDERRPMASGDMRRRIRPIAHGTDRGYRMELRRGLPPCEQCREAHNARLAERRDGVAS